MVLNEGIRERRLAFVFMKLIMLCSIIIPIRGLSPRIASLPSSGSLIICTKIDMGVFKEICLGFAKIPWQPSELFTFKAFPE